MPGEPQAGGPERAHTCTHHLVPQNYVAHNKRIPEQRDICRWNLAIRLNNKEKLL